MAKKKKAPNAQQEDQEARAYNWGLLATVILLGALLAQAPARIAAHFLPPAVRPMLLSWGGTLWAGQASWQYRQLQGQLRWQLEPLALLRLRLGVRCELLTTATRLQTHLGLGLGGWSVQQTSGHLAGNDLQAVLENLQLPAVPLEVQALDLHYHKGTWSGSAGKLNWQGGNIAYLFNGQQQHLNLPPVSLQLQGQQNQLQLTLQQQQGDSLAIFTLNGDMLQSQLKQRLLVLSPDYHGAAEPDAVVVTASQPLGSL